MRDEERLAEKHNLELTGEHEPSKETRRTECSFQM